jgi:hypothetical protein
MSVPADHLPQPLAEAVRANWFQPMPPGRVRELTFERDVDALSDGDRHTLAALYEDCFPDAAGLGPQPVEELARLLHAVMLVEWRLDDIGLLPPNLRRVEWQSAADAVGWPVDRIVRVDRWWRSSAARRDLVSDAV